MLCVCVRRAWLNRAEGVSLPAYVEGFNAAGTSLCSAALDLAALSPEGVEDLVRLPLRVASGGQVLGGLLCEVKVCSLI